MKALILSDLHFEFYRGKGIFEFIEELPKADVCILAGDITNNIEYPGHITNVLSLFCSKYEHVLFVAGNHEYYGSSKEKVHEELSLINCDGFHFLNRSAVEIDGRRFLGATLWFPDTPDARSRQYYLNDFHKIKDFNSWVYEENHKDKEFLRKEICKGDIVITHHLPSYQSVHYIYKSDPYNCYFVSEIDYILLDKKPQIHAHGHTHFSMDYQLGETRVICNPFGYKSEEQNTEFKNNLVVEI